MSRLAQKPIIHGRDHCSGGADPIPCLQTGGAAGDFESAVLATGPYAYWRLGETGTPWADTSGFGTPDNLAEQSGTTGLTPDVTGALPAGQDDGAVEFNYDGTGVGSSADYLSTAGTNKDFEFSASSGVMTVAVWLNIRASSASPDRRGHVIGNMNVDTDNSTVGWGLNVIHPINDVIFSRGRHGFGVGTPEVYVHTGGGVASDEWNFYAVTYDAATIRLYANGVLIDSTADTTGLTSGDPAIRVGYTDTLFVGGGVGRVHSWLYGLADEAVVWTRALTLAEIVDLYSAGVGAVGAGADDGDQVLVSDGAGGSHWGQANGNAIAPQSIVDRHVATGADIDPAKLEHPGGTTSYLRADGTWATPPSVATDTLWDAKGDLAAATGADAAAKVTVGTNGQVLTADSTASTGIKWAAASAGSPAADTQVWMPLTTTVGTDDVLVFDASHQLIPTLTPI